MSAWSCRCAFGRSSNSFATTRARDDRLPQSRTRPIRAAPAFQCALRRQRTGQDQPPRSGIYLIGTLRSFRASRTEELVRFGAQAGRVRARIQRLGVERLLEVAVSPGHKGARLDGKAVRSRDYFGGFNVVLFAPEDLRLPGGRTRPAAVAFSTAPSSTSIPPISSKCRRTSGSYAREMRCCGRRVFQLDSSRSTIVSSAARRYPS